MLPLPGVGEGGARAVRRAILALTAHATARPGAVTAGTLVLTLVLGVYAATNLGVNADTQDLLAEDLPFQQAARRFEAQFPVLTESLLVVVDAEDPSRAREAARTLREHLAAAEHVRAVRVPGADPFFERHALLYRSVPELEAFADHLVRLQPVLGELGR
ncbi:MAG: hypothetical protein R3263_09245, partial [Myxococcota bacterium]|nr:hypothetical protein [Myxococcota bacterium]